MRPKPTLAFGVVSLYLAVMTSCPIPAEPNKIGPHIVSGAFVDVVKRKNPLTGFVLKCAVATPESTASFKMHLFQERRILDTLRRTRIRWHDFVLPSRQDSHSR